MQSNPPTRKLLLATPPKPSNHQSNPPEAESMCRFACCFPGFALSAFGVQAKGLRVAGEPLDVGPLVAVLDTGTTGAGAGVDQRDRLGCRTSIC